MRLGKAERRHRERIVARVKAKGCERCGWNEHPQGLDLHHRNPSVKDFTIAKKSEWLDPHRLIAELEKCHVLCANCHRVVHATKDEKWLVISQPLTDADMARLTENGAQLEGQTWKRVKV